MADTDADGYENADDYEEINSDEVDRVIELLEKLAASVASENIQVILENASNDIYYLVYDDEALTEAA